VDLICTVVVLAYWVIIVWVVLSWIVSYGRLPSEHPVTKTYAAIDRTLRPILQSLRSVLPPLRFGGAALDLSPLVLIFGLMILQRVVC